MSVGVWLGAFLSPSGYFLSLLCADRFGIQGPPETVVLSLFCLISIIGLLVGGCVAWFSIRNVALRITAVLGTLFGILLQVGIILLTIAMATGYAQ